MDSFITRCFPKKHKDQKNMKTSTYDGQLDLPRLPIPELEETAARFLETVQALLTPTQYEHAKDTVAKFLSDQSEGGGPSLQSILRAYDEEGAENKTNGSYIEEFWSDAYLAPDCSVVLNLNPFFLLEEDPDAKIAKDQIARASSLTYNSLKFAAAVKNETMKPDAFKGTAICMDQFRSLFGSCRIPKVGEKDIVEVDVESDHVAVLYRNQFYYFRALWPRDREGVYATNEAEAEERRGEVKVAVSEVDIAQILRTIVDDGNRIPLAESAKTALGVLTTLPRKAWAKAREQLVKTNADNQSALEVIDSALFVLVLDDYTPQNIHDAAANMLHGTHIMKDVEDDTTLAASIASTSNYRNGSMSNGNSEHESGNWNGMKRHESVKQEYQCGTCCNRWYDKIQIIVCTDGSAGINFEHSAIDGHTALRFASDVYAQTVVAFAKSITKSVYTHGCPIPNIISAEVLRANDCNGGGNGTAENDKVTMMDINPKKLSFDIVEKLQDRIFHAETALGDALNADDTYVLEYTDFGKNFIVANKLSPDSVVQMSILIAYHRLYGGEEMMSSYEPVLTKTFYHGRTEAMRPSTTKAAALCHCWVNRLATKEDKLIALRDATKHHSKKVREALEGKGVDRHLYALKCIAEKRGLPTHEFFESYAWNALNHTVISTSNCGNPALRLFGFGPVTYDGFGVGYIIKDNGIQYSISSKHRQTRRYAHAIRQTLCEIGDLLEPLNSQALGHHRDSLTSQGDKVGKTVTKNVDEVEFADGWADTYGDTISVKQSPTQPTAPIATSPSIERIPSQSSFVGITRKVSKSKMMKSVGKKISDRTFSSRKSSM